MKKLSIFLMLFVCFSTIYSQAPVEAHPNVYHLNKISDQKPVDFSFKITNNTNEPVTIQNIHTTCGCTSSDNVLPTIAPHSSAPLKITFDPKDRQGYARWEILVYTSSPVQPVLMVAFDVEILREGMLTTDYINFGEFQRTVPVETTFWISPQEFPQFNIKKIELDLEGKSSEYFSIQYKKEIYNGFFPEPRPAYCITIHPKQNIPFGRWQGNLQISSDIPGKEKIEIPFLAKVAGDIGMRPDYISMGNIRQGMNVIKRLTMYHRNAEEFQILEVTSDTPFIKTGVVTILEDQQYQIVVSLDKKFKLPTGEFRAKLFVKTSHPEMSMIEIPVQGIIMGNVIRKFEKK